MATKKISELPLITELSGSNEGLSVIPVVVGGTTDQISIENFSKFVNRYNATTSSNHFIGNQTITGDVNISGKITAEEYHTTITSASVIYQSGSTQFGNDASDIHTFLGTLTLNGQPVGTGQLNSQTSSQALVNSVMSYVTSSMNAQSSSQDLVNRGISSVTGSMNVQSSSQDLVNRRISSTTGSINTTTASFDSVFLRISSTTGSINTTTSSFNSVFLGISSVTGAINTQSSSQQNLNAQIGIATASLNSFTGSVIGQVSTISSVTSSIHFATQSLNTQTGSQNSLNTSLGLITSSIYGEITSFNNVFSGVSNVTGAFATELGSIQKHILAQAKQTASQDLVNLNISTYTGSNESWKAGIRGEVSAIEAWTASLDSTYATDAQLYQLYQATASIHFTTSSINSTTASLIGIANGLMALTASMKAAAIVSSSTQIQNYDVFALNANLYTSTGSLIGITNGLMAYTSSNETWKTGVRGEISAIEAWTASLDSTYATDAQLYQLYAETASIKAEIAGIEALTASMKAASIVSSSQQIQNYFTFAKTGSANTFYGNQIVTGGLDVRDGITGSFKGNLNGTATYAGTVSMGNSSTNQNYALVFTTAGSNGYLSQYTDAFGGMLYNPSTNKLTVSGSIEVSGSVTINSGSITMPDRPAFRVVGAGGAKQAPTVLSGSCFTLDYAQSNAWDNTTGTFTAPIAGLYQVNIVGRTNSNTSANATQIIVYKNNTSVSPMDGTAQIMLEWAANTTANHIGGSTISKLAVGDTLKAIVAVGTASFDANDNFSVAYIG
jgi:hypothetical protein